MSESGVSRRNLICGVVAAGVAVPLVAACGGSAAGGGGGAIKASDVPVGGGKVFPDRGLLITQPKAGEFRAFSSHCTHQGSTLGTPVDGVITCPLHGSQFSAEDGHNERGPSGAPAGSTADLPKFTVTVTGSTLTVS